MGKLEDLMQKDLEYIDVKLVPEKLQTSVYEALKRHGYGADMNTRGLFTAKKAAGNKFRSPLNAFS